MIYVGTCGFGYKDWVGPFYPAKIKTSEMLRYYSGVFPAVEIDSSYYGVPADTTIRSLNDRTDDSFRFSFKAPQTVTHPPEERAGVHDDAKIFREVLEPLRENGKLAAVLLQFPNSCHPEPRTARVEGRPREVEGIRHRYLERLVDVLGDFPIVVEYRNREWQTPQTLTMLRELGVGWCNVDMPSYDTLMKPSADVTSTIGYVRMHGRNAQQWWKGTNVTRYDYLYQPDELVPWADRVADIAEEANDTYVFFNNHARGNAAVNAEMLERLLEDRYGDVREDMIAQPKQQPPPAQPSLFEDGA